MHVITGEIRKEPFVKGTLYIVELSESYKDKDQNRQYSNYKFFFNAKTEGLVSWYNEAFQVGKVISVSCKQLKAEMQEYNGKQYITLMAAGFPELVFSQSGESGGSSQPQQPQRNQRQTHQQQQNAPMDFDDVPF